MSIAITCPDCDNAFAVGDEMAGKRGRCPQCGGVFRAGEADEVPVGFAVRAAEPKSGGKRRSGGKKKRRASASDGADAKSGGLPVGVWAALVFVGVLLLAGGGYMIFAGSTETADNKTSNKNDKTNRTADRDGGNNKKDVASEKTTDNKDNASTAGDKKKPSNSQSKPATPPAIDFENDIIPAIARLVPYYKGKPIEDGTGSGFFVNDQQWIVTNHHVIKYADAVKVMVAGNEKLYDLEGIVYQRPGQDIAIVKPKEVIPGVKTLTVASDAKVVNADRIFVVGNPYMNRFVTTRGIVTRTIDRAALLREGLDLKPKPPQDAIPYTLVGYDARVFPGSDGSPVINAQGEVIAVHLSIYWMGMDRGPLNDVMFQFGLGVHSKHVSEAIKAVRGSIKPFKGTGPPPKPKPSDIAEAKPGKDSDKSNNKDGDKESDALPVASSLADKIKAATDECAKRKWTANDEGEYATLALLAELVTEAKKLREDESIAEEERNAANEAADAAIKAIGEFNFRPDTHVKRINEQATKSKVQPEKGIFVIGQVFKIHDEKALLMRVIGMKDYVIVPVSKNISEAPEGSRWIVLGQFTNRRGTVTNPETNETKPVPFLKVYALIELN